MLIKSIARAVTAVVGTAVTGLALLAAPTAAQAATSTCGGVPYVYLGTLCVNIDPNPGYRVSIQMSSGSTPLDWNLICENNRRFGSQGSFVGQSGQFYSYVFASATRITLPRRRPSAFRSL